MTFFSVPTSDVVLSGDSGAVPPGRLLQFSCQFEDGFPSASIAWSKNGQVEARNVTSFSFVTSPNEEQLSVRCSAENIAGSVRSNVIDLTVDGKKESQKN